MAPHPLTSAMIEHLTSSSSPSLLLSLFTPPTSSAPRSPPLRLQARAATPAAAAPPPASITPWHACANCISPKTVNNKIYFALFAILGLGLVAGAIWFFFFAENGGMQYEEGDWEDYKSAVLRRKGPDGKTIVSGGASTARSGKTGMTRSEENWERARWAAMSVVARDEKGRKGIMAKRGWAGTHSAMYRDDFTNYEGEGGGAGGKGVYQMTEVGSLPDLEMPVWSGSKKPKSSSAAAARSKKDEKKVPGAWELDLEAGGGGGGGGGGDQGDEGQHARRYRDRDVRHYAREKAAKVGGMNRPAEGSHYYDSSYNGSDVSSSVTAGSGGAGRHGAAAGRGGGGHAKAAEKRVLTEAERMERQWRREARRAARELAREGGGGGGGDAAAAAQGSRAPSPRKKRQGREYSFSKPGESYMDAYRPGR